MNRTEVKQKTHQQYFGTDTKSSSVGAKGTVIAPPAYGIDVIDKTYASMPLEEAIKHLPKMAPDQAVAVLKKYQKSIIRSISQGEERIRDLRTLRAESFTNYLIGGTIEAFGLTSLPSDDWRAPWQHVNAAYDTIRKQQIKESLEHLSAASDATLQHWDQLNKYLERTDEGADRSIATLRAVRDVSFVVVGALGTVATGGVLGGALIGTGVTTLGQVAEQGTAVSIGIQKQVDWGGIAFDAVLGFAMSMVGGKIAQRLAGSSGAIRLAGQNPAVSEFLKAIGNQFSETAWKEIVKRAVVNVLSGRGQSIVQGAARMIFDRLRKKNAQLTGGQFVNVLADQLLDPKAYFMDILGGEIGVQAHGYLQKMNMSTVIIPEPSHATEPIAASHAPVSDASQSAKAPEPEIQVSKPQPVKDAVSDSEISKAIEMAQSGESALPPMPADQTSANAVSTATQPKPPVASQKSGDKAPLRAYYGGGPEGGRKGLRRTRMPEIEKIPQIKVRKPMPVLNEAERSMVNDARHAMERLGKPLKVKTKAATREGDVIRSGFGDKKGGGQKRAQKVMDTGEEIGHKFAENSSLDEGVPGQEKASHAEKMAVVENPDKALAVDRVMCQDCFSFFQKFATFKGKHLVVQEPGTTWVFRPDGARVGITPHIRVVIYPDGTASSEPL